MDRIRRRRGANTARNRADERRDIRWLRSRRQHLGAASRPSPLPKVGRPCGTDASGRDAEGKRRQGVGSGWNGDYYGGGDEVRGPGGWLGMGRRAWSLAAALEQAAAAGPAPRRATNAGAAATESAAGDMRARAAVGRDIAAAVRRHRGGVRAAAAGGAAGGDGDAAAAAVGAAAVAGRGGGGGGEGVGEGASLGRANRRGRTASCWAVVLAVYSLA